MLRVAFALVISCHAADNGLALKPPMVLSFSAHFSEPDLIFSVSFRAGT